MKSKKTKPWTVNICKRWIDLITWRAGNNFLIGCSNFWNFLYNVDFIDFVECWSFLLTVDQSDRQPACSPLTVSLSHCKEAPQSNEAHNLTTSDEPGDTLSDVRQKNCQQSDTNVKFWRPKCCLQKIKCKVVL